MLLLLKRPKRILEIGAAVGFSAILMSEYAGDDCRIDTIENYEKRIQKARENIKMAGKRKADSSALRRCDGDVKDFGRAVRHDFCRCGKSPVYSLFPGSNAAFEKEGMLISDNVLQDGGIMESRFAVERRDRTIHSRMREYLYLLKHDDRLETAVVPIGDGASVSIKKE